MIPSPIVIMLVVYALSGLLYKDLYPDAGEWSGNMATGYIHDIGKINIPVQILKKPTPLIPGERDLTLHHTITGHVLSCYYLRVPQEIMAVIERDHHERRNGSGHPRGIRLNNPLVEIVAVCDVYDALISFRPYRPVAYDNRAALEMITGMAEREEISWDIVRALVARNRKGNLHYSRHEISTEKGAYRRQVIIMGSLPEKKRAKMARRTKKGRSNTYTAKHMGAQERLPKSPTPNS